MSEVFRLDTRAIRADGFEGLHEQIGFQSQEGAVLTPELLEQFLQRLREETGRSTADLEALLGKDVIERIENQAQDVTPPHSEVRVLLYEETLLLLHRWIIVMFCVRCGGLRTYLVMSADLSPAQIDHMSCLFDARPRCHCLTINERRAQEGLPEV